MNQLRLPIKREKSSVLAKRNDAAASNLESAKIILQDRKRCTSIQVEWAESIMRKQSVGKLF